MRGVKSYLTLQDQETKDMNNKPNNIVDELENKMNKMNTAWQRCQNWNNNELSRIQTSIDYKPTWKNVEDFMED